MVPTYTVFPVAMENIAMATATGETPLGVLTGVRTPSVILGTLVHICRSNWLL